MGDVPSNVSSPYSGDWDGLGKLLFVLGVTWFAMQVYGGRQRAAERKAKRGF